MGKFYEMINDFHDSSKKWDPITHYTLDATHDLSTKSVGEMGRALGWDHLTNMANKDKADFGRWGGNTLGAAAAIYGGMSAYGAYGGGAAGGTTGGTTAGTTAGTTGGTTAGSSSPAWTKFLGMAGNMGQGQANSNQNSMDQQQQLAAMLREQRRQQEYETGAMPGWVDTGYSGGAYG